MNRGIVGSMLGVEEEHRNPFVDKSRQELLVGWEGFYQEVFGIEADFSSLQIPKQQKGFDRLIVMAQGITAQRAFDKCLAHFLCRKWTERSLDEVVKSGRTAEDEGYTVWFRSRVEADEELKNLSASDLERRGIPGITLEERLLYELKFFKENGDHLDRTNVTLCAGSRCSDGHVPGVYWYADWLAICWYGVSTRDDAPRSRQAVS